MERRKNRRVAFEVSASVRAGRVSIRGTVDNLSMKGMFLRTGETVSEDSLLEISISLSGSSSFLSMELEGRAVRQTEAGIAIEFDKMDLDSFIHLRNVIAQNCDEPDYAYEEYCRSIMSA
jgi:hypothetical protein